MTLVNTIMRQVKYRYKTLVKYKYKTSKLQI